LNLLGEKLVVAAFSSLKENLFMVDQQKGFALAAALTDF
jgi:hypothetical protein